MLQGGLSCLILFSINFHKQFFSGFHKLLIGRALFLKIELMQAPSDLIGSNPNEKGTPDAIYAEPASVLLIDLNGVRNFIKQKVCQFERFSRERYS